MFLTFYEVVLRDFSLSTTGFCKIKGLYLG